MQQADQVRIRHMYDAVRTALMLARNRTRNDLEQNITLQLALVKLIEIVGEAAVRVSPELKDQAPDNPGRKLSGCVIG